MGEYRAAGRPLDATGATRIGSLTGSFTDRERAGRFERTMLPHLDAAHALARWIVRDPHDAQDVVQEAYMRALRYFDGFAGEAAKPWLLGIVRNAAYDWLGRNRPTHLRPLPDADALDAALAAADDTGLAADTPETRLIGARDRDLLGRLIGELPPDFRDVLVLRDIEGLSYAEIAAVAGIPAGTVMSRLCRARALLRHAWNKSAAGN
jgi:RNA polymerase sigma-70 factor (ECF subfamily)